MEKYRETDVVWIPTDTNTDITVSRWTYEPESTVDDMVKEAAPWNAQYNVEITEFKGHSIVVSDKGAGNFEIHILVPNKPLQSLHDNSHLPNCGI